MVIYSIVTTTTTTIIIIVIIIIIRFALRTYNFGSHGPLTKFIDPDMKSLLWSMPHIQSESDWLLL